MAIKRKLQTQAGGNINILVAGFHKLTDHKRYVTCTMPLYQEETRYWLRWNQSTVLVNNFKSHILWRKASSRLALELIPCF